MHKVSKFESNAITLTSIFGKKKIFSGQFDPNTTRGLKLSEKDAKIITSTDSERLFSAASHVSDEKRKGDCCMVTVMFGIAKWLQTISK